MRDTTSSVRMCASYIRGICSTTTNQPHKNTEKNPAMEDVPKRSNYVWFFISSFYWEAYKTFIPSSVRY